MRRQGEGAGGGLVRDTASALRRTSLRMCAAAFAAPKQRVGELATVTRWWEGAIWWCESRCNAATRRKGPPPTCARPMRQPKHLASVANAHAAEAAAIAPKGERRGLAHFRARIGASARRGAAVRTSTEASHRERGL